ncbi:MAG: hypothetical protein HYV40_03250 [Candidatus Levybacteria bacterium]|nr:hypothetical protein [Candidatus Levybacteria bacterium]
MSQVSKYPISKDISDRIFEIFLKSLVQIKNQGEAEGFITDLLTPTEKIMLSKRLAIAFLLEKNYNYRTIQRIIRVSAPTIRAVNVAKQYGSKGYKTLINKIMQEETLIVLFEEAIAKFLSITASASKGKGMWKYLRQQVENETRKKKRIRNLL